jgi:hypothetical protein
MAERIMSEQEAAQAAKRIGRSYGDCSLCCLLCNVPEAGKEPAKWCPHCRRGRRSRAAAHTGRGAQGAPGPWPRGFITLDLVAASATRNPTSVSAPLYLSMAVKADNHRNRLEMGPTGLASRGRRRPDGSHHTSHCRHRAAFCRNRHRLSAADPSAATSGACGSRRVGSAN